MTNAQQAQADQAFSRLMNIADGVVEVTVGDQELIKRDIQEKLTAGWTVGEIVAYVRNTEEINPTLSEDQALLNMRVMKNQIMTRLAAEQAKE